MKNVLIAVESPAKAKSIKKFLGHGYTVLPTVGHFKEMPLPKNMTAKQKEKYGDYALDFEDDFRPLYKTSPGSQKIITSFKDAMKRADEFVIASDADSEGALIGLLLLKELKPTIPTYRATWNEITERAVKEGLKNKKLVDGKNDTPEEFFNAASAAQTRASWDRLYGFSVSPYLWRTLKPGTALHEDTLIPTWGKSDVPVETIVKKVNNLGEEETIVHKNFAYKRMKDVKVGDLIIDDQGRSVDVIDKYSSDDEKYKITFDRDGQERVISASGGHLWQVEDREINGTTVKTTREMYRDIGGEEGSELSSRFYIPLTRVKYSEKNLSLDPYTLGLWLGDEECDGAKIHASFSDLEDYRESIPYKTKICSIGGPTGYLWVEGLNEKLEKFGCLSCEKFIPEEYLQGSVEQRLELLAGIVDSGGVVGPFAVFSTEDELLARQVQQLVESLGYKVSFNRRLLTAEEGDSIYEEDVAIYDVRWAYVEDEYFCKISWKMKKQRSVSLNHYSVNKRGIRSIELLPESEDKFYCIEVDSPERLFLCGESFIQTHNSGGRVQTPAARLVVERELRRLRFKSVPYYSITGVFEGVEGRLVEIKGKKIASGRQIDDDGNIEEGYSLITDKSVDKIIKFLESKNYEISDVSSRAYRRKPPAPFNTSSALQAIGSRTGMGAKQITAILQRLYDTENLITYIRTVSIEAAPEAIEAARKSLEKKFGKKYVPASPNVFKDKKQDNSGHECLRSVVNDKIGLLMDKHLSDRRMNQVFEIISKRMMASQSIPVEGTTWTATISSEDGEAVFRASETEIHEHGWTVIYEDDSEE